MNTTEFGAFVDSKFKKGFILDEERIRKINEVLITRGKQINEDCKPTFKVYKADTFSYTTDDIQKILNEKNAEWEKIVRLTFLMKFNDEFLLELDFAENDTKLHIEGKDRDIVFLIFSELKQYISNEVAIIRPVIGNQSKQIVLSVTYLISIMLIIILMYSSGVFRNPPLPNILQTDALSTQDLQIKLNFLIQHQSATPPSSFPIFLIAFVVITTLSLFGYDFLLRPFRYLFPNYIFLIGKEIEKHSKRVALRQNILWGVIITTIIGIVAGLVVWLITK